MTDLDPIEEDDLLEAAVDSFFDPYAGESAFGIDRDRWERPLILPDPRWRAVANRRRDKVLLSRLDASNGWPDGKIQRWQLADGRRPFPRISGLAAGIDAAFGLGIWFRRHIALSIARRPDLQELLCTMTYTDGKLIDGVCDEALLRAKDDRTDPDGKMKAAHRGTAFHRATTPGIDPVFGPRLSDYEIAKDAFEAELERCELEIVASERFVVSPLAAGTYDHLVRDRRTGAVHVIDKKTGSLQWLSHLVQVEGYSGARHYDPVTGRRTPLHPDLDPSVGFIASTNLKSGACDIWEMSPLDGSLVKLAHEVWAANKSERIKPLVRKRT